MAVDPHKMFGGRKFGLMDVQLVEFFRQLFKKNPASTYASNKAFGTSNRYDDLDSPVITVSAVNVQQATLTWLPVNGAINYQVEYSTNSSFTNSTKLPLTTSTSATITGLSGGSLVYTRVTAFGKYREGVSASTQVKTKVSAPSTLAASNITATGYRLTWGGQTGVTYVVERATTSNFSNATVLGNVTGATSNEYIVTGATASTTYYHRVKGTKNTYPESNYATVNVTTTA